MFQEVLAALDKNEPAHARDLLTRLIKADPNNGQYWLYMSAVVESQRERLYCLNEAQKLMPDDPAVKRGLAIFGGGPVDPALVIPLAAQKRNWQALLAQEQAAQKPANPITRKQVIGVGGAVLGLVAVIAIIVIFANRPTNPAANARRTIVMPTAGPTSTFLPTPSPVVRGTEARAGTPLPEVLQPEVAYTPTPLYVQVEHSISENFRSGMRAYERGDWAAAVTFLKNAAGDVPNAPDIPYLIGEAERQQGNLEAALAAYNDALKIQESYPPALLGRARLDLRADPPDLEAARADLEAATTGDPAYADAWLEMAHLDLLAQDGEAALGTLDKAADLERAKTSPLLYLYRAQVNLLIGDAQQALDDAKTANQMDVSLLEAYRTLGEAYTALGEYEAAIPPLEIYAKYAATDAAGMARLGIAYAEAGQTETALEWLNKSIEAYNKSADAFAWRGTILLEQGNGAAAYQDFDQALVLDGKSFRAALGRARALLALKYPNEAFDQFTRAMKLADTPQRKGEYLYYYAQALEQVGNPLAGLRAWNDLLALPESSIRAEWRQTAESRAAALSSPTPTATPTRKATP